MPRSVVLHAPEILEAIHRNDIPAFQSCLAKDIMQSKAVSESGCTLLHYAALHGCTEIIEILVKNGAILSPKDSDGMVPLHWAAANGRTEAVRSLLDVDVDIVETVLSLARVSVLFQTISCASYLTGVILEGEGDLFSFVSPFVALYFLAKKLAPWLIAQSNIGAKDNNGRTPLHVAAENGHEEIAQLLLEGNANIGAKDNNGRTPLHVAAENGHEEIAQLLLNVEARIKVPLAKLVGNGRTQFFLYKGADIRAKDNGGRTPLHVAAENGHEVTAQLLLDNMEAGASPQLADPFDMGLMGRLSF